MARFHSTRDRVDDAVPCGSEYLARVLPATLNNATSAGRAALEAASEMFFEVVLIELGLLAQFAKFHSVPTIIHLGSPCRD
jgi:hypothetical protein